MVDLSKMNHVQQAAYKLIQSDFRYLYTVIKRINPSASNYIPSLLPYIGVMVDGAEDWVKAINNSSNSKLPIPRFSRSEERFYEQIRASVKLWQQDYNSVYDWLSEIYEDCDRYFGSICKPIARLLRIYDIYGIDMINGVVCGNTVLCKYFMPFFELEGENEEYIISMFKIGGMYAREFNSLKEYPVKKDVVFRTTDYCGLIKSPVGNKFSDKFVLYSILCQINFLLYCVDYWVEEEIAAKLRFAYLLYYSLVDMVPQINLKLETSFSINKKWRNDSFRNAMAHYKLGVVMKKEDLIQNDLLFGLTNLIFNEKYIVVKESIFSELKDLAMQIGKYLGLNPNQYLLQM